MSKIICDVCGTAYPETSTQCPICGCVRPADAAMVDTDEGAETAARNYTPVKGGRFSKSNVKKRNRAKQNSDHVSYTAASAADSNRREQPRKKKKNNTGLVVIAIILLLAVAAVVVYLAWNLFGQYPQNMPTEPETPPVSTEDTEPTEATIPCQDIEIDVDLVEFDEIGVARMIYVSVSPADTTDTVTFESLDGSCATVTDNGKVVAVGPGETTIVITCGDVQKTCKVVCNVWEATEPTEPEQETSQLETEPSEPETEPTTEEPTTPDEDFELNREDITFSFVGDRWDLYDGDIDPSLITWTTDNEWIATITDGVAVAVGAGTTEVHGEYNGVKVTCIIRCAFSSSDDESLGGHGGVGEG